MTMERNELRARPSLTDRPRIAPASGRIGSHRLVTRSTVARKVWTDRVNLPADPARDQEVRVEVWGFGRPRTEGREARYEGVYGSGAWRVLNATECCHPVQTHPAVSMLFTHEYLLGWSAAYKPHEGAKVNRGGVPWKFAPSALIRGRRSFTSSASTHGVKLWFGRSASV
jgi:hypothetical protein